MSVGAKTWIWLGAVVFLLAALVAFSGLSGVLQLALITVPFLLIVSVGAGLYRAGVSMRTVSTVGWVLGGIVAAGWFALQLRSLGAGSLGGVFYGILTGGIQAWFVHALVKGGAQFVEGYRGGRGVEA